MTLETDSSQKSSVVAQKCGTELRGKSFGGLAAAAGVGESVYGVCEEEGEEPGSKGGPRAPQPLHTLHTDPLLFPLHTVFTIHCTAHFYFNHRTVFALSSWYPTIHICGC